MYAIIKENDNIYLACNVLYGDNIHTKHGLENSLIWKVKDRKNTYLVSNVNTPSWCFAKTLTGLFSTEDDKEPEINHEFIVTHTLPIIYQALKDKWFLDKDKLATLDFGFSIIHNDKRYDVDEYGYCHEIFDDVFNGLKQHLPRTISLLKTKGEDWKYRILKEFVSIHEFNMYSAAPIFLVDVKNNKTKLYTMDQAIKYVKNYEKKGGKNK